MPRLPRVVMIPLVCAVVGFLLAHYGTRSKPAASAPPSLSAQASGADFTVRYPAGWTSRPATTALRGALDGAVVLAAATSDPPAAGSSLAVGLTHPAQPGTPSAGVRALVSGLPAPQTIALARTDFVRYPDAPPKIGTGRDWIYLLATTRGTLVAICSAPRMTTPIAGLCERMLSTLHPTAGSILSVGADPGYALEVNQALGALNSVRSAAGPGLLAPDPRTRGAAAGAIAAAERRAARVLSHLSGVPVSAANRGLVLALSQEARTYQALAAAAGTNNRGAYASAVGGIRQANRALARADRQLRELGYRIG
jgi:hypothetical protein